MFVLLLAQGGEFAFVVFQAAAGAQVLDAATASLLSGAVALSMLVTPLLLLLVDRYLLPRYANCARPQLDEIAEAQDAAVIIAGFGRYGQIVGRMLLANGTPATVLDHDADMIETAGKFGYKVFYGDASRLDLLRVAGADQAKVLVVAVDDVQQSLAIVDLAKEHFPRLVLVARARDVTHWNQLRSRGLDHIERELFESSLLSGRTVLEQIGASADEAGALMQRFRRHNLELLHELHVHHNDRSKLIAAAVEGRLRLEEMLTREREAGKGAYGKSRLREI